MGHKQETRYNPDLGMTTINNQDHFLRVLDANPSWPEAVRTRILGEELLQLPVKFDTFAQEHRTTQTNIDARLGRIEDDTGTIKGDFARTRTLQRHGPEP